MNVCGHFRLPTAVNKSHGYQHASTGSSGYDLKALELREILREVVRGIGYDSATKEQQTAVESFVYGKDVFVSLPTDSGKSLCYACLPCVFDEV